MKPKPCVEEFFGAPAIPAPPGTFASMSYDLVARIPFLTCQQRSSRPGLSLSRWHSRTHERRLHPRNKCRYPGRQRRESCPSVVQRSEQGIVMAHNWSAPYRIRKESTIMLVFRLQAPTSFLPQLLLFFVDPLLHSCIWWWQHDVACSWRFQSRVGSEPSAALHSNGPQTHLLLPGRLMEVVARGCSAHNSPTPPKHRKATRARRLLVRFKDGASNL